MCHGFFDAVECLNVSLEVDLVVCYGTGNFQLVTLISCPANLRTPPTFAPFELPLELYMDDDHIRPAMNASSHSPSIPLTKLPSNSTFMDDSTFVESTFLTKPASARPTTPAALGNTAVDKPAQAQADDVGASSSSSSLGHFDCVLCHMIWASSISATGLC